MAEPPVRPFCGCYLLRSCDPAHPRSSYIGFTVNPLRRVRQHNGEIVGGGRYTSKHRPWRLKAIYGPYADRSEALKAERALKKGKRGEARCHWTPEDTYKGVSWCRGLGPDDPRIEGDS